MWYCHMHIHTKYCECTLSIPQLRKLYGIESTLEGNDGVPLLKSLKSTYIYSLRHTKKVMKLILLLSFSLARFLYFFLPFRVRSMYCYAKMCISTTFFYCRCLATIKYIKNHCFLISTIVIEKKWALLTSLMYMLME